MRGGPGADHSYVECFEDFLPQNGIEFYYYDQVDSTNSNKPSDPKLWTIERFRDEVEAVRKGLGLEQVYIRHLCRLKPWPEPFTRAFRNLNEKICD